MTTLRASPFDLEYGDLVVAKIRALNSIDYSGYSTENSNGALIETEPLTSATPQPQRGTGTSHL
jgi:hypothetical protein